MLIDIIEKRLERLKKKWPNKKLILFRHKTLIKKETKFILKRCINKDNLLYMRFPVEEKIFIGYGQAIKYSSKNDFTQFSNKTYNIK